MKLRSSIAQELELASADAVFAEGDIRSAGRAVPIARAAEAQPLAEEDAIELDEALKKKPLQSTFGAHFVEVGVDAATGEIRVRGRVRGG